MVLKMGPPKQNPRLGTHGNLGSSLRAEDPARGRKSTTCARLASWRLLLRVDLDFEEIQGMRSWLEGIKASIFERLAASGFCKHDHRSCRL